jgi:hypothetical protein
MDIFKEIISVSNPPLKQIGFVKKGNSFYLEVNKNFGVINFQKSRESTKEAVKFTINFGVYSNVLGQWEYNNNSIRPEVEQCQWRARIGDFMTGNPDFWWEVKVSDNLKIVTSNVMDIVQNIATPEINKRLSDDGLINSWMNETYAGTTEIGKFIYVTTLLKAKGDFNTLNQVVDTFMEKSKGKPNASIATEHLNEIQYSKE